MNKLSKKSIEKFEIFLDNKEFSYISLTRHEFKILFNIYNSVIPLISEAKEKENKLIKYLEDKIKEKEEHKDFIYKNYDIFNNELAKKSFDEDILLIEKYQDILESLKSGKYE